MSTDETPTLVAPRKTFAIVRSLVEADAALGVSEIASELGYTKSTTYKHLATMVELGYVEKQGVKYAPTLRFTDVGEHVKSRTPIYQVAKPYVDRLIETTNESAGLVVRSGNEAVDVYHATSDSAGARVNSRYLHCSAPGKAILSRFGDREVEALAESTGLVARTEHTITDLEALDAELRNIRDRGIAFERREQHANANAVAVPFEHGETEGAVFVAGHADRLSGKRLEEDVPGMVLSAVRNIRNHDVA